MTTSIDFDSLGDFCKSFERSSTDRHAYHGGVLLTRLDGRAFHSLAKHLNRPFDTNFSESMVNCTRSLVKEFHADVGYTQSDEISLAWTLKKPESQWPFGGRFQKLESILAAHCSVVFDRQMKDSLIGVSTNRTKVETFDCRSWQVPSYSTAGKVFLWRQWDAERNSVNMLASHHFSPKELHGVSTKTRLEMLISKGINYGDLPCWARRGTFIIPKLEVSPFTLEELASIPEEWRLGVEEPVRRVFPASYPALRSIEKPELILFSSETEITNA